jgi:2-polyprenyl-6-methoxyphenol hydroxylase-like FAD-dependent oxidoreductase
MGRTGCDVSAVASGAMRILIVGAGIGGLAVARATRQHGLECEIVERGSAQPGPAAGIYLPGNGMAALRRLGLAEEVAAHGAVVGRRRLFDDKGRRLIDFDEAGLWRGVAEPVALHRTDLHRILADGAGDVPIRYGVTVQSVRDGSDAVRVAFDDGNSGAYDLVIGADGIHSSIRTSVFGGPPARLAGQVGWRFVIDDHPGIDGWNAWLGRDRGFLALGIGGDRVYGVGDMRSTDGADPTGGDLEAFRAMFEGYPEPVPSLLSRLRSADELWFSPFEEVAPPAWMRGRVVLLGDAAHATAPNMAEGASLAMEDALVLTEALSGGGDLLVALAAYADRRAPRVAHVQHMTQRRDRLRYLDPTLRRVVTGVAGHKLFRAHYRPLLDPP